MKANVFTSILACLLLGAGMTAGQSEQRGTNASMSVSELLGLLPAGLDMDSPNDLRNLRTLKSIGPSLLPVINEAMDRTTNVDQTSLHVSLAVEIPGDHSSLVPRLHRLLDGEDEAKILASLALRQIGTTNDCPTLLPLLHDPKESIRINVARTLAELGDDKTLETMTQIVGKRKAESKTEDWHKDYSIAEMEKAIAILKKRSEEPKK